MKDTLEEKLAKCYHPDIVKELLQEDHEAVKAMITQTFHSDPAPTWKLFSRMKSAKQKGKFAYNSLLQLLENKAFNHQEAVLAVDWKRNYIDEYAELSRILALLFMVQQSRDLRVHLATFLKHFAIESANHVRNQSKGASVDFNYDKTRKDISTLRECHQSLADYFGTHNLIDDQLEVLFAKVKITTSMMGNYPEAVGPDMTAVALTLEKKGDTHQAAKFYQPVLADFVTFLADFEKNIHKDDFNLKPEDKITLHSLHLAVSRLKELADYQDTENLIERINNVLAHRK